MSRIFNDQHSVLSFRPKRSDHHSSNDSEISSKISSSVSIDQNLKKYLNQTSKWRQLKDYKFLEEKRSHHSFNTLWHKKILNTESRLEKFEPTYQTEPVKIVDKNKIENKVQQGIKYFLDKQYKSTTETQEDSFNRLSVQFLSTKIKNEIKPMVDVRHRIVVLVNIVEDKNQSIQLVSNCLWDTQRDMSFSVTERKDKIAITAIVFLIYKD